MPGDLDDFEIRQTDERIGAPDRSPRKPGWLRTVFLAVGALVVLGTAAFLVEYQPWRSRAPLPVARPSPSAPARPATTARGPLPSLDESDDYVRQIMASISAHPELARWLAQTALVRTVTAVVSNIADGETPRPHLAFLTPRQRFRATSGTRRRMVADPASFAGYDSFADAVASVDARAALSAFRAAEPLFDAAYRDLGHPEGFRSAVDRAIAALLAVPVPSIEAALVPRAVGFAWVDPRLEGLTDAQRQFLRIGPRNIRLVQAKLRELQELLTGDRPEEDFPGPSTLAASARPA